MIGIYCDASSIPGKTLEIKEHMTQSELPSKKDIISFNNIKYTVTGKIYQKLYNKNDSSQVDCYTIYLKKLNFFEHLIERIKRNG